MPSRAANWIVIVGAFGVFAGLCLLIAALGQNSDSSILALGASVLSLSSLMSGGGLYWNARCLQEAAKAGPAAAESKPASRRVRGGCELCGSETPVIQCRVHQLHLCPACLTAHYDFRSCVYIPSTRRAAVKNTKTTVRARSASTIS